ncbi:MAG: HAMP domain-containing sensor histidine kinase [Acidobacteriota bacterium]
MTTTLERLATLVRDEGETILARWREQVRHLPSARQLDTPALNDHIPELLKELSSALIARTDVTIPEALLEGGPQVHGLQRLKEAFDIEEVVAEYNILRGCIHDLAEESGINLQGKPFHIVNRVFDLAIGLALQAYSSQRALEVQQRREEYLAFVVHDLRTPLNAISLVGRVLELRFPGGSGGADTERLLKALRRSVRQLEGMVEKVLEENANLQTEGGVRVERREFDLWPLVEGLIRDLQPIARSESTRLINEVADDFVVYADASLLKRVFQNLVTNAIKYTPRGEVIIGARELDEGRGVEFWVRDNGAGIPPELIEKVFDKGETDPESAGGAGLGLAIVRTLVDAHGGKVTVESREGIGSTFRCSLPTKAASSVSLE